MAGLIKDINQRKFGEILKPKSIVVPPFQRPYSWSEQAIEFFDDLLKQLDSETEYFIGPMVLVESSSNSKIIDGQQRILTTALLLAALRDISTKNDLKDLDGAEIANTVDKDFLFKPTKRTEPSTYSIQSNMIDLPMFQEIIKSKLSASLSLEQKIEKLKKLKITKNYESWSKLLSVYTHFIEQIEKIIENKTISEKSMIILSFIHLIEDRIVVAEIIVEDEDDAFEIFQILNAKGMDLGPVDLIKNFIFRKINVSEEIARKESEWAKMLNSAGSGNRLAMIIRYSMISKGSFVREKDIYKALQKKIRNKSEAEQFLVDLDRFTSQCNQILEPTHVYWNSDEDIVDMLERLKYLSFKQHIPVMFAILEKNPEKRGIKSKISMLFKTILQRIITNQRTGEFEQALGNICKAISDGDDANYNKLLSELCPTKKTLESSLQDKRFDNKTEERLVKLLFVLHVNNSISTGELKVSKELSLEHIHAKVKKHVLKDKNLAFTLGNLTLLPTNTNSKASDKPYSQKKGIYLTSMLSLNKDVAELTKWTDTEINQRSEGLSKEIAKILQF